MLLRKDRCTYFDRARAPIGMLNARVKLGADLTKGVFAMRQIKDFTLIELMVTVTIVGIIASLAIPVHQNHVARASLRSVRGEILSSYMGQFGTFGGFINGTDGIAAALDVNGS